MKQWLKDCLGNLLGRPSGRARYMTCPYGHVTLSRLPDNSRCDFEKGCDAIMRPLTAPLLGIFPLSDRVIQLQTMVYKEKIASASYVESYQSFVKGNQERNELVLFFRSYFPADVEAQPNRPIIQTAIARLKEFAMCQTVK